MEIFGPFYKFALASPYLFILLPSFIAFLVTLCDWKITLLAHVMWALILVFMWHTLPEHQEGWTILVAMMYSLIALPTLAFGLKILSFPTKLLLMLWRKLRSKTPDSAAVETAQE